MIDGRVIDPICHESDFVMLLLVGLLIDQVARYPIKQESKSREKGVEENISS